QKEFAGMMGVEDAAVSRWERGRLHPSPKVWSRIREIALRSATPLDEDVVQASHVYKYVVALNDLTHPTVVSKGVAEALARVGIKPAELTGSWWAQGAQASPYYDVSAIHALEIVEANKGWLNGSIAYAEAHAFSTRLHKWLNMMVAPLPDRYSALIEAVEDSNGDKGGFWVRFIDIRELVVPKRSSLHGRS
ncbi:MAG: helix-turn-helix transcriptional regulator, partial [Rhodomicrobium sp.]